MPPTSRVTVVARPGSSQEAVAWDPWRKAWTVKVREPAREGRANEAILRALAGWLSVPPGAVRWLRAGRSASKLAEVDGLGDAEVALRLDRAARTGGSR